MALIIGTLLALLGLGVAVYPFARRRWGWGQTAAAAAAAVADGPATATAAAAATESAAGPDTAALADIYAAIRTLQLERELGRIPEGLYREQLQDYRIQAALALRRQEQETAAAANPANAGNPANDANPANAGIAANPGNDANPANAGIAANAGNPGNPADDAALESEIQAARAGLRPAAAESAGPAERD